MSDRFRALVCITTCNRAWLLKRYVAPYLAFCRSDRSFDFLVSLDGSDPESIAFCDRLGFPLVYSDEREGGGPGQEQSLSPVRRLRLLLLPR